MEWDLSSGLFHLFWRIALVHDSISIHLTCLPSVHRNLLAALRENGCEELADTIEATPAEGDPQVKAKCRFDL